MDRGRSLLAELGNEALPAASSRVHLYPCDLADLNQVRRFIADFKAASSRLDLLTSNCSRDCLTERAPFR